MNCPGCQRKIADANRLIVRRIKTIFSSGTVRCKCGHDLALFKPRCNTASTLEPKRG